MMKKMLLMLLVGVIGVNMLTGCGKSDEGKAVDEIAQHVRDEAAADGVDIDKMLEEEKEQYEEQYQTEMDEVERRNAAKVELGDFAEEKMSALASIYEEYKTAKWDEDEAKMQEISDKIKAEYAVYENEYNEMQNRLLEEYSLDTLPSAKDQAITRFYQLTGGSGDINDFVE